MLVFFSYAHQDRDLRDKLEEHLSNLKYRGLITTWHMREIGAGEEFGQQIDIHLNAAHIILLLISASFMASEYCYGTEMKRALELQERGQARVIPVLLRPVLFTGAPFARLEMFPSNGKPVMSWRDRDSAFVDIALGIERVVQERFAASKVQAQPFFPAWQQQVALGSGSAAAPSPMQPTGSPAAAPSSQTGYPPQAQYAMPQARSRGSRSLIPVGLIAFVLIAAAVVLQNLQQSPNPSGGGNSIASLLVIIAGIIVGLLLLVGFIVTVRALLKRARTRADQRQTQQAWGRALGHSSGLPSTRYLDQRQTQQAMKQAQEGALRQEQEIQRRAQEEIRRRALEEAPGPQEKRIYYEKALAAYEQALGNNSCDANAHSGKGNALVALERYNEALQAFQQAVALDPRAITFTSMGDVLCRLKRPDEALAAYQQAIARDPEFTHAYHSMGDALEQLGKTSEAEGMRVRARQLGYEE